jgi:hypothetical protein
MNTHLTSSELKSTISQPLSFRIKKMIWTNGHMTKEKRTVLSVTERWPVSETWIAVWHWKHQIEHSIQIHN